MFSFGLVNTYYVYAKGLHYYGYLCSEQPLNNIKLWQF